MIDQKVRAALQCNILATVDQQTNEAEWLANRTKGIGGSDIGPICGVSPFTSARQIYLAKTGQYTEAMQPDNASKERMRWGHLLEPVVAEEYCRRTGNKVCAVDAALQHKDFPWALASIDRLILDPVTEEVIGILECKTTSEYMNDEWDEGNILLTYLYQLNWYLWVTGLKFGTFACLVGGNKFYIYEIYRNDELINDTLIPAAKYFWEENVLKLVEPEMQAADTDFANSLYSSVVKNSEIVFEEEIVNELATTVFNCKAQIKELESIMEEAQNRIKDRLQDKEIGYTPDFTIKWSPRSQKRIDSDKVRTLYPDIVPYVTKTVEFRAMYVKAVKS